MSFTGESLQVSSTSLEQRGEWEYLAMNLAFLELGLPE